MSISNQYKLQNICNKIWSSSPKIVKCLYLIQEQLISQETYWLSSCFIPDSDPANR